MLDVYEVTKKLLGPIDPIGETRTDDERYENLKATILVVDKLLSDIDDVAYQNKDCHEHSRKRAADEAAEFFNKLGIPD